MSQALYRKYRSKSLSEVIGQTHITDILTRALKTDKIAHAYLFTGPRGVGKTSVARILAHEINHIPYTDDSANLDIIEIDAASNNGVEDVRQLREFARIAPTAAAKKVYIIDEVHMLSKHAFNALLKTLEEPPEHVVFILATTDVEKLPATIISRTQRFSFHAIQPKEAAKHLRTIADKEKIAITDDALSLVAERGDGSFRDSISLLDQLSSLTTDKSGITVELIESALGLAPTTVVENLLKAIEKHTITSIAEILTKVESDGISPLVLTDQLIRTLQTLVPTKPQLLPLLDALLDVPRSTKPEMKLLAVLGSAAYEPKPRSAALATPVREVSASVEELSAIAATARPEKAYSSKKIIPSKKDAAKPAASTKSTKTPKTEVEPAKLPPSTDPFNWDSLIAITKEHYLALYSVLVKCGYTLESDILTIYTINPFYKKKLDDPKYQPHLYESLAAAGGSSLTIHTIAERPPIKDSQAAAIADIMGGGVEVSLDAA